MPHVGQKQEQNQAAYSILCLHFLYYQDKIWKKKYNYERKNITERQSDYKYPNYM